MGKRPSFGRSKKERGFDQFDTPPIALAPLFNHEPLLSTVRSICEPFCGKGNLVITMRARGLIVHASDIEQRGCPDSTVLDFLQMQRRPDGCNTLLSNPPYSIAQLCLEHAWRLGFGLVVFLMELKFMHSTKRFESLHPRGHLRRVYPIAERLQDMHDANFTGRKASQPLMHSWFVFDSGYCGAASIIPVSIDDPEARMPWQAADGVCAQCRKPYSPERATARFCSNACRQQAYRERLSVTAGVTATVVAR